MIAVSGEAAMTTPVAVEYLSAEASAAAAARFSGAILSYSEWEVPLIRRLFELEQRHPTTVTARLVDRAIHLLRQVATFDLDLGNFRPPFIGPISGGGVIFEWSAGSRQLSLTILPEGTIEYLKWETSEQFEEGDLPPRATGRLRELITWLTSGGA